MEVMQKYLKRVPKVVFYYCYCLTDTSMQSITQKLVLVYTVWHTWKLHSKYHSICLKLIRRYMYAEIYIYFSKLLELFLQVRLTRSANIFGLVKIVPTISKNRDSTVFFIMPTATIMLSQTSLYTIRRRVTRRLIWIQAVWNLGNICRTFQFNRIRFKLTRSIGHYFSGHCFRHDEVYNMDINGMKNNWYYERSRLCF